jgi:hypothetical protein
MPPHAGTQWDVRSHFADGACSMALDGVLVLVRVLLGWGEHAFGVV